MASNDDILLKKPKRQGLLVEEYLRGVDIQEQLPPAGPAVAPPPAAPQIPQEMTYLNTEQGQAFVEKALTAPDTLTPEEQQQWTATVNAVPELQQLQQQYQAQAEQAAVPQENRLNEAWQELRSDMPGWLRMISPSSMKIEGEILGRFQVTGLLPFIGGGARAKLAADVLSEMFLPAVDEMEKMSANIPWPISPHEKDPSNAQIIQDRRWNKLSPEDKQLYFGQQIAVRTVAGAVGFTTQQADMLINPEKYGMTPQEAFNETADGFVDMLSNAPDQVGYIAEIMFGTRNNPISKLAEAAGTIVNLPKIKAGEKRAQIREEAINMLYEAPESLLFTFLITRGMLKATKKIPIRVGKKKGPALPEGFKVAEEVPRKAAEKPKVEKPPEPKAGEPIPKEGTPEAKGAKTIELEPVEPGKVKLTNKQAAVAKKIEDSGVAEDHIQALWDKDDPVDAIVTNLDLNSFDMKGVEALREHFKLKAQKFAREKYGDGPITVYRAAGEPLKEGDIDFVTTEKSVAQSFVEGSKRIKPGRTIEEFTVEIGDIVGAQRGGTYEGEGALLVRRGKPVAAPKVPEVIATKNEMADASRNLAHTKRFIKDTEEFLKREDIPDPLRTQQEAMLKQARIDEASYQAAFDKLSEKAEGEVRQRKVTAPEQKPWMPKEIEGIETPDMPKSVGVQNIRSHFERGADVPIRTGRTGKAAGTFNVKTKVARLQSWDDVGSLTHEIAHSLQDAPDLKNLWKKSDELGKLDYEPLKARKSEGFAEYVRHYMTGSADVTQLAPKFTEAFQKYLKDNPELGAYIEHGRKLITKWREQGASERIWQQVDYQDRGEPAPFRERVGRGLRKLGTLFEDDIRPLEYAEKQMRGTKRIDPTKIDPAKSPTQLARFVARTANAKARSMVLDGMFDFSGKGIGMSLRAALEPVNKKMKEFTQYAYSKHALDSWKRGVDPGIDLADAQYTFDKFDNPTFRSAADAVTRWQDGALKYAIDAGVLSKEAATAMKMLNPSYIPLKRVFKDGSHVSISGQTLSDIGKPFKKRTGSGRRIRNPWHAMIESTAQIISAADRTRVGKALVELAEETKGVGKWVEKVQPPKQLTSVSLESMKKALEEAGLDLSEADMGQIITMYSNAPKYFGRENIVSFWRNGKREFFEVHPELFETLKSVDNLQMQMWLKVLGAPARTIRLGATGLQAGFGLVTNPIRDAFGFMLQSEFAGGSPLLIAKGLYKKIQPKDQMNMLFKRAGADMSTYLGMDRNSLKMAMDEVLATTSLRKAYNVARHPIEITKEIFSVTESGPRLAEFEAAYLAGEKLYGKGSAQAQIMARNAAADVTVNFGRMGVYGRAINQIIPFWNAQVQGLSKFIRYANAHPELAGLKAVSTLTLPTVAIWLANKDQQWYKDMKPWEKYGFWNFEIGTNADGSPKIFKLPRPFEWGVAFASMPEMALNYFEHKDPAIIKDGLEYGLDQMAPDFYPPFVKIPMELHANYDFFRDRKIDPTFEVMYKDPEQRFSPYTTETAKFIGEQFGLSPRKIEHLVAGATGGLGMDAIKAAEQGFGFGEDKDSPSDIPVVGRLFARTKTEEQRDRQLTYQQKQVQAKVNAQFRDGRDERGQEIAEQWNKQHPEYSVTY